MSRNVLALVILLLLTPRSGLSQDTSWDSASFLRNVEQLARLIDIQDTAALSRALGSQITTRPYCAVFTNQGPAGCGVMHAWPDPVLQLPGAGGVRAQYYALDRSPPPGSDEPLIGTFAVLDLFPPLNRLCLRRADVRTAFGPEAFAGSTLGRGEPLDVALNYVPFQGPDYRTLVEFVFVGRPSEDGCLAFASIREANVSPDDRAAMSQADMRHLLNHSSRMLGQGKYNAFERWIDLLSPRDVFDPSADDLPLGLTLAELVQRYPGCVFGPAEPTESVSPLTDAPPWALPLLPMHDGVYLSTGHNVREAAIPDGAWPPTIDATLLIQHHIKCTVPNPYPRSALDTAAIQYYGVLTYQDRIAVLIKSSRRMDTAGPAPIVAAEAMAQASGSVSVMVKVDRADPSTRPRFADDTAGVLSFKADGQLGTLVGPGGIYAYLDLTAWRSYSSQVDEFFLTAISSARPLQIGPICASPRCAAGDTPSQRLLRAVTTILARGDLRDYRAARRILGRRAVLSDQGHSDTGINKAVTRALMVTFTPGPSLSGAIDVRYTIIPDGLSDGETRLSPYHRLEARIDFGNLLIDPRYCVTRTDMLATFGPDQRRDPFADTNYARKFAFPGLPPKTFYVTAAYNSRQYVTTANTRCAATISLYQYRLVQPQ